jgi:hypothetical protein
MVLQRIGRNTVDNNNPCPGRFKIEPQSSGMAYFCAGISNIFILDDNQKGLWRKLDADAGFRDYL